MTTVSVGATTASVTSEVSVPRLRSQSNHNDSCGATNGVRFSTTPKKGRGTRNSERVEKERHLLAKLCPGTAAAPVYDTANGSFPEGTVLEEVISRRSGKVLKGLTWKTTDGRYVRYRCLDDGFEYEPGDNVYVESECPDQPYFISTIQEFRRSKGNSLMVHIKWFYRPSEVPDQVYQLLVHDRNLEHKEFIQDQDIRSRELFISDASDSYPVSVLRGSCRVYRFPDLESVCAFDAEADCFFFTLGYNPETRRLASTQGEIRVGPSHQARLPEFRGGVPPALIPERCEDREELKWRPWKGKDGDLLMYLRAARSMAAFQGMCDGGSPDDGCMAASRDDTTINALDVLHDTGYDPGKALQALVKCPLPKGIDKKWTEDEQKRFVKGLRQYGKNFFKIQKELLPHKQTPELVEFYYLWKKTPGATACRPHRRHRRQNILRRIKANKGAKGERGHKDSSEQGDISSASEEENESDDSDSRDLSGYYCRHCYATSSKDWHHAGREKQLLCTDCRLHFKKYGDLPKLKEGSKVNPEAFLFRPVKDGQGSEKDSSASEGGGSNKEDQQEGSSSTPSKKGRRRKATEKSENSPSSSNGERERKSPSTSSTASSSGSSSTASSGKGSPVPSGSNGNGKGKKRKSVVELKEATAEKKRKERAESPSESASTESGQQSVGEDEGEEQVLSPPMVSSSCDASTTAGTEPTTSTSVEPPPISSSEAATTSGKTSPPVVTTATASSSPPRSSASTPPEEPTSTTETSATALLPPSGGLPASLVPSAVQPLPPGIPPLVDVIIKSEPGVGIVAPTPTITTSSVDSKPDIKPDIRKLDVSPTCSSESEPLLPVKVSPGSPIAVITTAASTAAAPSLTTATPIIPLIKPSSSSKFPEQHPHSWPNILNKNPNEEKAVALVTPLVAAAPSVALNLSTTDKENKVRINVVPPFDSSKNGSGVGGPVTTAPTIQFEPIKEDLPSKDDDKKDIGTGGEGGREKSPPIRASVSSSSPPTSLSASIPPTAKPPTVSGSGTPPTSVVTSIPTSIHPSQAGVHHTMPYPPHHPAMSFLGYPPYPYAFHPAAYHPAFMQAFPHPAMAGFPPGAPGFPIPHPGFKPPSSGSPQQSSFPFLQQSIPSSSTPTAITKPSSVPSSSALSTSTKTTTVSNTRPSVPPGRSSLPQSSSKPSSAPQPQSHQSSYRPSHQQPASSISQPLPASLLPPTIPGVASNPYVSPVIPSPAQPPFKRTPPAGSAAQDDDDDEDGANPPYRNPYYIPRGPSPEPKVEDSECHRSQSAIFLRHWNRGEGNSCARTDLTFKAVQGSKLARKREERLRREAEKQKEEKPPQPGLPSAAMAAASRATTGSQGYPPSAVVHGSAPKSQSSGGPIETISAGIPGSSPYDRLRYIPGSSHLVSPNTPSHPSDTPALRQLNEFARPHASGFQSVPPSSRTPTSVSSLQPPSVAPIPSTPVSMHAPHPSMLDPLFYHQLYGDAARKMEMEQLEQEKRARELREIQEREMSSRLTLKHTPTPAPTPDPMKDPHLLDLQRRSLLMAAGGITGGVSSAGFHPAVSVAMSFPSYPPGLPPNPPIYSQIERERLERMAALDPSLMFRLHMVQLTGAPPPTSLASMQAATSQPPRPPSSMLTPPTSRHGSTPPTPTMQAPPPSQAPSFHPAASVYPSSLFGAPGTRAYEEQILQQLSLQHEQLQRQFLLDRERLAAAAAATGNPLHPSVQLAQHEEYLRRERELKARAMEEVARNAAAAAASGGGRPL